MNQPDPARKRATNRPEEPEVPVALLAELLPQREPRTIQSLAQCLKLSPTAVTAQVQHLSQLGCVLDEHPQRGVQLRNSGLGVWVDFLQAQLSATRGCRDIEVYRSTASTQDRVRQRVESRGKVADRCIVIADHQHAGRGRLGRRWLAPPGTAAIFSTAILGDSSTLTVDRLTFAAAVAVARGIESAANLPNNTVQIKWPNDLMIEGRKLAGILVETFTQGAIHAAVLGVGINVALQPEHLPESEPDLRQRVVSLAMLGASVDRLSVLSAVLVELDRVMALRRLNDLLNEWRRRNMQMCQRIELMQGRQRIRGTVVDLDPHEGLIIRTEDGALIHLPAATTTVIA